MHRLRPSEASACGDEDECLVCEALDKKDSQLVERLHQEQWRDRAVDVRWYRRHPTLVPRSVALGLGVCASLYGAGGGDRPAADAVESFLAMQRARNQGRYTRTVLEDLLCDRQLARLVALVEADVGLALAIDGLSTGPDLKDEQEAAESPKLLDLLLEAASEKEQLRFIEHRDLVEAAVAGLGPNPGLMAKLLVHRPHLAHLVVSHGLATLQMRAGLVRERADGWFAAFVQAHAPRVSRDPLPCVEWQQQWGWTLTDRPVEKQRTAEQWQLDLGIQASGLLDAVRTYCPCADLLRRSERVAWHNIDVVARDGLTLLDRALCAVATGDALRKQTAVVVRWLLDLGATRLARCPAPDKCRLLAREAKFALERRRRYVSRNACLDPDSWSVVAAYCWPSRAHGMRLADLVHCPAWPLLKLVADYSGQTIPLDSYPALARSLFSL